MSLASSSATLRLAAVLCGAGKRKPETAALPRFALDADLTTMAADDFSGYVQA
jgi:hypothetical protein